MLLYETSAVENDECRIPTWVGVSTAELERFVLGEFSTWLKKVNFQNLRFK